MTPPHLVTERLVVRLAELRDVGLVRDYFGRNGHRYSPPLPPGMLDDGGWPERILKARADFLDGLSCKAYVFNDTETSIIGTVTLTEIVWGIRLDARLGYAIDAESEGRGLAREATEALLGFAFETLGLHRIEATYDPSNQRSTRLLQRLGFEVEGRLRAHLLIGGEWRDHILAARIAEPPSGDGS